MSTPNSQADANATLGTILKGDAGRDAIHIAVLSVVAAHNLSPAYHVGLLPDGTASVHAEPIGVVDPFLNCVVKKGERFWLCLYPRTITSLRHVWTHPAIGDEADRQDAAPAPVAEPPKGLPTWAGRSKEWIAEYADSIGVDASELMDHATAYVEAGYYWTQGSRFEGESLPEEFWDHYETVTGTVVPAKDRGSFFSCSC